MKIIKFIIHFIKSLFEKTKREITDISENISATANITWLACLSECKCRIIPILSLIGLIGGLIYYIFGEAPGPPILIFMTIIMGIFIISIYLCRKRLFSWCKRNKKKAFAIGTGGLMIFTGAGIATLMDEPIEPPGAVLSLDWSVSVNVTQTAPFTAKDIDGDGIFEIFVCGAKVINGNFITSDGRIVCINGSDGSINWEHNWTDGTMDVHLPTSIGDLNNDGTYEIVIAADSGTLALNCEDGSEFWDSPVPSGWHNMVIADVDQNNLPYVYVSDHGSVGGNQRVSKLWGTNGSAKSQVYHYYSCYGGVSAADLDRDGDIEFIVSDRAANNGKSVVCYDGDLVEIWNASHLGTGCNSSSHCQGLIDVTGDADLEVVGLDQGSSGSENGGIFVLWGNNGTAWYHDSDTDMGCHIAPNYWDMDEDGQVEVRSSYSTTDKIWDLVDQSLDAELGAWSNSNSGVSQLGNIIGDSSLEIIGMNTSTNNDLVLYDTSYSAVHWENNCWGVWSIVQDVDNDGLNELLHSRMQSSTSTYRLYCWDTLIDAPSPRVRTDTGKYSERRLGAASYIASLAPEWWATIRNDGVDYFTWLGPNVTASTIADRMIGFDEVAEYLSTWTLSTWDSTHGLWEKYYGDRSGTDFTVHTFDIIHTNMDDSAGSQKIGMDENVQEIDYTAARNISLTKTAANKGYAYSGYTLTDKTTLENIAGKTNLTTGELIAWWNRTAFAWEPWIIEFSDSSYDHTTSQYDVFVTKVSDTRYLQVG